MSGIILLESICTHHDPPARPSTHTKNRGTLSPNTMKREEKRGRTVRIHRQHDGDEVVWVREEDSKDGRREEEESKMALTAFQGKGGVDGCWSATQKQSRKKRQCKWRGEVARIVGGESSEWGEVLVVLWEVAVVVWFGGLAVFERVVCATCLFLEGGDREFYFYPCQAVIVPRIWPLIRSFHRTNP